MNGLFTDGENTPIQYTIKIDRISDMLGYMVEVVDKFNSKNYTLSGLYLERKTAIKDADAFVNDLFEKEISMYIN